ncbi:MAG: Maf family protein [Candidatus Margulisbacteria bacterium]|jgi:septum formation protein|nr:Maf family protein [Candidatus Margulisiibacteriota bacterium]
MRYILASASPRRKLLLQKLLQTFTVVPSRVDESAVRAQTPEAFAVKAALAKALEVSCRHPRATVIGADTIVVLGQKILGKPRDNRDAVRMLRALTGHTHRVITGLAVVGKRVGATFVTTTVRMKKVGAGTIAAYVATGRPLDKAGAYGIQEIEATFIDRIDGDYDNVVGLPVAALKILLKECQK